MTSFQKGSDTGICNFVSVLPRLAGCLILACQFGLAQILWFDLVVLVLSLKLVVLFAFVGFWPVLLLGVQLLDSLSMRKHASPPPQPRIGNNGDK